MLIYTHSQIIQINTYTSAYILEYKPTYALEKKHNRFRCWHLKQKYVKCESVYQYMN